jgi:hypothetical protein
MVGLVRSLNKNTEQLPRGTEGSRVSSAVNRTDRLVQAYLAGRPVMTQSALGGSEANRKEGQASLKVADSLFGNTPRGSEKPNPS